MYESMHQIIIKWWEDLDLNMKTHMLAKHCNVFNSTFEDLIKYEYMFKSYNREHVKMKIHQQQITNRLEDNVVTEGASTYIGEF